MPARIEDAMKWAIHDEDLAWIYKLSESQMVTRIGSWFHLQLEGERGRWIHESELPRRPGVKPGGRA